MNHQLVLRSFYQETQNSLGIHHCHLGCGQQAFFYAKQAKKWRCSKCVGRCPSIRKRKSIKMSGENNHFFGKKHSKEHCRHLSESHKGIRQSEETRQKNRIAHSGKNHYLWGKKRPPETLKKMSEAFSGSKHPNYGKPRSPETKAKIAAKNRLNYKSFKGKHHTAEARVKMSKARSGYISKNCSTPNGAFKHVLRYRLMNIENVEFVLQGTWEVKMAEFLNKNNILWVKGSPIQYILDGLIKHYSPDFYLPLYDKFIEVKGYYPETCKIKMAAVLSQNKISLFMAFKKEIDHLEEFLKKVLA